VAQLKILFVCIGNTCRSPMAEAMARSLGAGRVETASAGIMPYGRVAGQTVATLDALGYASDGLASKGLEDLDLDSFDIIVSLVGESGLSYLPRSLGAQLEAWPIPDPFGEDDEVYIRVARMLESRIRSLLDDLDQRELSFC
jgi:arsenate reductase